MSPERLQGLLPAVFSPMFPDGSLNLEMIEPLVEHLLSEEVGGFYVCGSTGEGPSLRREERQAVAAVPPVYYKGISVIVLIKCLKEISSAAPRLPLFYYHIPSLTGVEVDVLELLRAGRELFSGENLKSGKIGKYECPV